MNKVMSFSIAGLLSVLISCEKKDDPPVIKGYAEGIYIINEGSYNANNGSISFLDEENLMITNDIFGAANGRPLGDIVQSFSVVNDSLGFIVVNHSAKVEIVRLFDFYVVSEPIQVTYPRYFLQVNSTKGYLTAGNFEGNLHIIDLGTMTISDSISVGFGPEVLLRIDDKVYVANSGGWGSDSTLSVINTLTDQVTDTLFVEKIPADLALDSDENIWVYCKGYTNYADIETDSYIQKINPENGQVLWQARVGSALEYASTPAKLAASANGTVIYYNRPDGIYRINAGNPVVNSSPFIDGNYYGIDVNPENSRIYVFESSFTGNGTLKIFEPDGTPFAEGTVGIGPNGAVFHLQ